MSSDNAVREIFEHTWGRTPKQGAGGCAFQTYVRGGSLEHEFMGVYINGEDLMQSDPNTQHVAAALMSGMECG